MLNNSHIYHQTLRDIKKRASTVRVVLTSLIPHPVNGDPDDDHEEREGGDEGEEDGEDQQRGDDAHATGTMSTMSTTHGMGGRVHRQEPTQGRTTKRTTD
jgi:hypothetical protein